MFNDERTPVQVKVPNDKVREAISFVHANGETTIANYASAKDISVPYASTILRAAHTQGKIGLIKPDKSFGKRAPYVYVSEFSQVTAGVERDPESDDPYTPVLPVKARKRPVRGAKRRAFDFLADKQVGYRFDVLRLQKACKVSHQPVREALKPLLENGLVTKDGFKKGRQQFKKVGNFGASATATTPADSATVSDLSAEDLVAENREIDAKVEALLERRAAIKARLAEIRALVLDF